MPEPASSGSDVAVRTAGTARSKDELSALDLLQLWPAAVRVGLLASLRVARWATSSTVSASRRIAVAVQNGESPAGLAAAARDEVVGAAREALGITDIEATLGRITAEYGRATQVTAPAEPTEPPQNAADTDDADDAPGGSSSADTQASSTNPSPQSQPAADKGRPASTLRARGEELVARSAGLEADDDGHPAFGVVLEELAPDEARILRVLAVEGDQAAIDITSSGPLGGGDRLVAGRVSLLAEVAGAKHPERLQIYLDNLLRLGLVRNGDDPLDESDYGVIEAQPQASEALEAASAGMNSAKVIRRRFELSAFGRSFCDTCLPT